MVGRPHGLQARSSREDRGHRRGDLFRLGPHGLPLDHPVSQHRRHAHRIGQRAARDADVSCIRISSAVGRAACPNTNRRPRCPSLWPGGWWRVRDIVEQQKIAAWATVDLAARNRETVLWNMYLKGTRQTERGANGAGEGVCDCGRAARSADGEEAGRTCCSNSGVEVHQAKAQFIADGSVYGPGSFVVSMAQPKQGLVRWMLGPDVLSGQLLHARSRGQSDPPVRHVDRHVRRVHGRPRAIRWARRSRRIS